MKSDGPFILWLMGPTSSGKTTLAQCFVKEWRALDVPVIEYDGDEVRDFFGKGHGFKPEDRLRVVSTLVHLSARAAEAGLNVVVSALTAHEDARRLVRERIPGVVVGYVECPIELCAKRDTKGLYEQAERGEIETLIGWNIPYQTPKAPDLVLNTEKSSPHELFVKADAFLRGKK